MSEEETKYLNNVASQIMEQTDPRGYGCVSYDWLTGKIKEAYEQGRAEGLRIAIRLLKQLRPEMGGLGGPIYILKEWLDGKADIPEEVSAGE